MAYIHALATALPRHSLDQDRVRETARRELKGKVPFLDTALGLFANAGVSQRYLVRDLDDILGNDSLGVRNGIFAQASCELGAELTEALLARADLRPEDIDLIITTSCTGFMIPSVDAFLINRFRMRHDIKRLPITELGCAAGAMAFSRAADYLRAYPDHKVMIIALEFPSLTYRRRDFRPANLVSAALFGDGGAGAVLSGDPGPCRIRATRTHFYYDTPEMMGFDLSEEGFKIILDKKISDLVRSDFGAPFQAFMAANNMRASDLRHYVFHPGGRRIMDNLREVLQLEETDIAASRQVLNEVGNLSSASVFWVLDRVMAGSPEGPGVMAAFGPGFNAELLLLDFAARSGA